MMSIAVLLLWSIALSPSVSIFPGTPAIRFDDLLVCVILTRMLLVHGPRQWPRSVLRLYAGWMGLMCSWVMLTMLVNNRLLSVGDYFEIYKLVKYVLVVYCFYYATMARWQTYVVGRHLGLIGACLVLFNVVGLLDFRWFNVVVMPYYAAEHHLEVTERLERAGDSVRMLGTMGNPNNNAVLWGFMAALLVALCVLYKRQRVLMLVGVCVAVTMCLLSQSRTTVVGLASGFLVYSLVAFQSRYFRQVTLPAMVLGGLGYVFVVSLKLQYLLSPFETDLSDNTSWSDRVDVWGFLFGMIQESPWFGYGPNKEFFYQRQLFSENEYILMAWRYGYVGVIFYLGWIILPWFWVRKMTRDARSIWSKATVIMTPLVLVVAVTNNPMAEPRLMLLYAAIAGMTLAELDNTRKGGVASGMR